MDEKSAKIVAEVIVDLEKRLSEFDAKYKLKGEHKFMIATELTSFLAKFITKELSNELDVKRVNEAIINNVSILLGIKEGLFDFPGVLMEGDVNSGINEKSDSKLIKQAAIFVLVMLVDENQGSIDINTNAVRRAFNDTDDAVKFEMSDGTIQLLSDTDAEVLDEAVLKWKADHPEEFNTIVSKININEFDQITN